MSAHTEDLEVVAKAVQIAKQKGLSITDRNEKRAIGALACIRWLCAKNGIDYKKPLAVPDGDYGLELTWEKRQHRLTLWVDTQWTRWLMYDTTASAIIPQKQFEGLYAFMDAWIAFQNAEERTP